MKNMIYMKLNRKDKLIQSYGIGFKDFCHAIKPRSSFLLLAGQSDYTDFNYKLFMEFVKEDDIECFFNEPVGEWGDFCWIDFQSSQQLDRLSDDDIAELLFMKHMKRNNKTFIIEGLNNRYAYLCHDDGTWNNLYLADTYDYVKVIAYILKKELGDISLTINENIISEIYKYLPDGLIIESREKALVLYTMGGKEVTTVDELEDLAMTFDDTWKFMDLYIDMETKEIKINP